MVDTRALRTKVPGIWDPPHDHLGTAAGTDIEPLQAGMSELDCKVLGICELVPGFVPLEVGEEAARPPLACALAEHETKLPPLLEARCPDEIATHIETEIGGLRDRGGVHGTGAARVTAAPRR